MDIERAFASAIVRDWRYIPQEFVLDESATERFLNMVDVKGSHDCHNWRGGLYPNGYGSFGIRRERTGKFGTAYAHRVAYEMAYCTGIMPGLVVDHLCRNRRCVNPNHLDLVTHRTNLLRGVGFTAVNASKTHCVRGHAFDDRNTRWYRGKRDCRRCCADRQQALRERRRG